MDDLPIDFKPEKTRNTTKIIMLVAVIAIISFAVYFSYESKYVDNSNKELHATLIQDISMSSGTIRAALVNDGTNTWNITSIDISGATTTCKNLPTNIIANSTANIRCGTRGAESGESYNIIITFTDVNDPTKKYLISEITEN